MKNLPAHLQEKIDAHNEKLKAFGITPMHEILEAQKENMENDDFHPLHGMV